MVSVSSSSWVVARAIANKSNMESINWDCIMIESLEFLKQKLEQLKCQQKNGSKVCSSGKTTCRQSNQAWGGGGGGGGANEIKYIRNEQQAMVI